MTRDEVVAAMAERGLTRVKTLGHPDGQPAADWDPWGMRSTTDWQHIGIPQREWYGDIDGDDAVDGWETVDGDGVTKRRYRWRFLP